tara:strand:- start:1503 stop:1658 length:156 start_codon:yes stop_codon:yes gene_type:complete
MLLAGAVLDWRGRGSPAKLRPDDVRLRSMGDSLAVCWARGELVEMGGGLVR